MIVKHEWTLLNLAYRADRANRVTEEQTETVINQKIF